VRSGCFQVMCSTYDRNPLAKYILEPAPMASPEHGSALFRLYADHHGPRPIQRSISGSSPLSKSTTSDHPSSMAGYSNTHSNRPQTASFGGIPPRSNEHDHTLRDSHDLSIAPSGRGRDSLLDNLLLSFDKIGDGTFGGLDNSPFFSNIDEVDDNDSIYSSRRSGTIVSGSSQPNSHFEDPAHKRSDTDQDYEGGSLGVSSCSNGRDTRSRGRGLGSSHGYANGFEPVKSAPAPSIRTRNRTPSPPRSPRLVRPPSNKSIKSLRNRDLHLGQPPESVVLPPLLAFANPPQSASMGTSNKSTPRPGFFRRVFGGGSSNSSSSSGSANTIHSKAITTAPPPAPVPVPAPTPSPTSVPVPVPAPAPASINPPQCQPMESPPSVITKKASFFRRRKKSFSDIHVPPIPTPVKSTMEPPPTVDPVVTSPGLSLRTTMNSFHSPVKTAGYEPTGEDREASYLARDATIRTVVSSDSIHPRRPSFFSESARNRDIVSFAREELPEANGCNYQKERWDVNETSAKPEDPVSADSRTFKVDLGRPQTSPRTFFLDNDLDEQDIPWPPSNSKRGILSNSKCNDGSFGSAREMRGSENATYTTRSSSAPSRDSTIVDLTRLEKQHSGEGRARKTGLSSGKSTPPLSLDTTLEIPRPMEGSWILSPSPGTPTVTLQKDGVGEKVEILGDDDDIRNRMVDEEPSEEDKEMARKIFEGNEEFVSKARAAAWLGDA
jgi:hypothetical protein